MLRIGSIVPPALLLPLWLLLWVGGSVLFRLNRGKPLSPAAPSQSRFVERHASGNSLDTLWGRLGGARNCLLVAITDTKVYVTPQFPFNLMILPEIYRLEDHIPFKEIRSCTPVDRWYGKSLRLDFSRANGTDGSLSLRLRKRKEFLDVLDTLLPWPSNQRWGV